MDTVTTNLIITPNDSLFFKEARPMNAKGNAIIESEKRPPNNTLLGAIKAMIGRQYEVDFQLLAQSFNDKHYIKKDIDFTELYDFDKTNLAIEGVHFFHRPTKKFLYKAPAYVCYNSEKNKYAFLKPSKECYQTDMGTCKLPVLPSDDCGNPLKGYKPLRDVFFSAENYKRILNYQQPKPPKSEQSKKPDISDLLLDENGCHIPINKLITKEFHLGIEIESNKLAKEGMLYQNNHIRLHKDFSYYVIFKHPTTLNIKDGSTRLGGEGRVAFIQKVQDNYPSFKELTSCNKVAVILNTDIKATEAWMRLEGFDKDGRIKLDTGQEDYLISAVLPKSQAIGGWDLAKNRPRPMTNYLTAGSTYFLELSNTSLAKLKDSKNIDNIFKPLPFKYLSLTNWYNQSK
jgi:CRISPR-associated protein Cmr3